ncbi:uncharacterized protein LOC124281302 isoform X2 [Haliotis rubra]|uniref:uncharacterized protein LOC124281302 isoform X2 n=1 Tax=Haliotis rubra TaxID=36100 RepID=UPI001EE612BF|nr:uncharacterized protein LOC124281302 isoform X2 [Haliotis rubra]
MKLFWFLVFGATMFHCGVCDNTGNDDQLFYVDIEAPGADQDIGVTMATINNTLYSAEGITVEQAFKVVGEPRVITILKFQALCDWRPLEVVLLAASLTMNVKSLYGEMNLAADLNINKDLLARAPEPDIIRGEFLYLVDVRITMRGQTTSLYKEEVQNLIEYCLKRRAIGIRYVNYNVLGEFPTQMLYFVVHRPKDSEMARWRYKDEMTEMTISLSRIERLDDYLSDSYCN